MSCSAAVQLSFLPPQDAPPSVPNAPPRVLPRAGKRPPLIGSPLGQVKNYVHAKQLPLASRPSVFQSPDEDEEEDYEQWLEIKVSPPEGVETRKVIEKLARFVAEGGPELEKVAMENYKDKPAFSFLHDKNSREFLYYRKKVAEIRKEAQKSQTASQKGRWVEGVGGSGEACGRTARHVESKIPGGMVWR